MMNNQDSNNKAGCGVMQGQLCSPMAGNFPIQLNQSGGVNGGEVGPDFGPYRQAPGDFTNVTYDSQSPAPGQTIGSNGNLATPFDQQGGSIGAVGQASGSGQKRGDLSTPWTGPFGEI